MTVIGTNLKLKYVFDSDPYKVGKNLVNSSIAICKPSIKTTNENDLIIIFTISYQDEIIDLLISEYKYKGDILCLEKEPHILKI